MPRRFFGRSLIIVVAPMILLQGIVTYVFFDRHYDTVTSRLARGVAYEIGYLVLLENIMPAGDDRTASVLTAAGSFGFTAEHRAGERITRGVSNPGNALNQQLVNTFDRQIAEAVSFETARFPDRIVVNVQVKDGVLRVTVPRERVTAANVDIFVLWMLGSSIVLITIAVLFLRNQVKPIERLAFAAESFGKGRSLPDFKPYGAAELRRAAKAFIEMRERIERHVQQRTDMLAGISHDLKTPLTRMRLQLAMSPKDADNEALAADVAEMERMVNEYLEFARGESGETAQSTDLAELVTETVQDAARARQGGRIAFQPPAPVVLSVKRNALKRCVGNLISNAVKYGAHVQVSLEQAGRHVEIAVDDDGPGITDNRLEEAFLPFHRLDEGRNLQAGGVGLGLAIARDIARAHGGDIVLGRSALGGLRAAVLLPV